MGLTTCFGSGCKQSGGVVSDLERRHGEGDRKGNPHLFFSLGIGFVIAATWALAVWFRRMHEVREAPES